ncbi:hypothetical protein DPMN_070438 [Dreissena polymorpha]|uniref:Uncharacterized protein n=1 Tax=Dreissena polymorpha TaxID=45954 RepID=A0A9D3Z0Z6_DREPO|nr:hypothetical protein DPMN_070438 [Dreissena polymorpha]
MTKNPERVRFFFYANASSAAMQNGIVVFSSDSLEDCFRQLSVVQHLSITG